MKNILIGCLLIACFSCKKNNDASEPVSEVRVFNDSTSALAARIEYRVNRSTGGTLVYIDQKTGEEKRQAFDSGLPYRKMNLYGLNEATLYKCYFILGNDNNGERSDEFSFTTASIPAAVKKFYRQEDNVINDAPGAHFMFTSRVSPSSILIVNHTGKLVWYKAFRDMLKVVRFTQWNTMLCLIDEHNTQYGDGNVILELSLSGDTLFHLRHGSRGFTKTVHHDLQLNQRGNIVAVTNVPPVSGGGGLPGDGLLELDRQGNKVWEWTTFDSPDAAEMKATNQPWINSLAIDKDLNYIISLRTFSQVWKVNAQSGAIMWKLGNGGNVQMDAAGYFQFQHYAHRNDDGDIMLFDNGSGARPQSRLLSFSIDEKEKKAVSRLQVNLPAQLYSPIMGSAMQLPGKQLLAASSTNSKIVKTDLAGNLLWTLNVAEPVYRGEYIGNPFTNL
ncbi:hypothetical protein HHL16_11990 [Pseudoflavitalea sp. G-6-1-2]|uniref:aryl-sulfate sulfotransferase n=1 Tax=Pseudoflavitalea sp. G-6-1-2 TaxID=2728841 RepID=UPI00146B83A3|nr:aryl-sulfate sulfotransferase [Pseudoflavitalea sp. G-6-1-2]NML21601.1 hypothetical protein [Pseudoflavitalea sp. G-6-1-2]